MEQLKLDIWVILVIHLWFLENVLTMSSAAALKIHFMLENDKNLWSRRTEKSGKTVKALAYSTKINADIYAGSYSCCCCSGDSFFNDVIFEYYQAHMRCDDIGSNILGALLQQAIKNGPRGLQ